MKKHYSEADLLETYYTQPGQSMPVMMHLADCEECEARYETLERKVRALASCQHDKPETFWARQRISVMRRIGQRQAGTASFARSARVAAAVLVLTIGGVVTWRETREKVVPAPVAIVATVSTTAPAAEAATAAATDPWQSDELKDFQSMVAWESWVEPGSGTGDQSL